MNKCCGGFPLCYTSSSSSSSSIHINWVSNRFNSYFSFNPVIHSSKQQPKLSSSSDIDQICFCHCRLPRNSFTPLFGKEEEEMTITPTIRISDRKLLVKEKPILSGVPDNVISTSASSSGHVDGIFIGADFHESNSRHVVSLGTLRDVRFLASFRFKLWWMSQRMGNQGSEIPLETQFLLLESKDETNQNQNQNQKDDLYIVLLPLIEGAFRTSLQGNSYDELELVFESGDTETMASSFTHSLFISTGSDPFITITEAISAVKSHLKTFRQRSEKKLPKIVDYFGWCTWDAFYQEVTQEGVEAGLSSLTSSLTPPKFVIIDDGWQSVGKDQGHDANVDKSEPLLRLTGVKENEKFRTEADPAAGIKSIVSVAKEKYGLKYVYMWHAITGYWGGVHPGSDEMEEYRPSFIKYPRVSDGVVSNEPGWKSDVLAVQGLGLVNPKSVYKFYNELHGYLGSAGVDGVKVDVQCILETLGAGLGGRVELTRQYHQALDASVARNFPDNGIIACMSHNTDALYCSKQTGVIRASDDFYPRDPMSHTIHIASVAYNSVFLGEFMQPDWDMFHSLHPAAEYHASARAISGGPVYVSDAPGKHNFDLLKKLVLPDGSILRARLPGRPTRDCLFTDPSRDGVSLLKIWNMNKYTGVLGVYNCQGAAWSSTERKNMFHHTGTEALSGAVRSSDIHFITDAATDSDWNGDCAVLRHRDCELVALPYRAALPLSLKVLEHEIFTVSPIKILSPGFSFAPLGLINMFNAGGAIEELTYKSEACGAGEDSKFAGTIQMEVKGCGLFGVYSSAKPKQCTIGSGTVDFEYDSLSGLVTLNLGQMPEQGQEVHVVKVHL